MIENFLNQTYFEECNQKINTNDYSSLKSACERFTVSNLNEIDEELATLWMLLFQFHFEKLSELDRDRASENFEQIFPEKSVRVLFSNQHLFSFEETKNVNVLKEACRLFSKNPLKAIDETIANRSALLFIEHMHVLNYKNLGNTLNAIHSKFPLPLKLKKNIRVICMEDEVQKLPLAFLLPYRKFQEKLNGNIRFLRLENTSMTVIQAFHKYLYDKKIYKNTLKTSNEFAQLFDIARWAQDEVLTKSCLEQLHSNRMEINFKASTAAIEGDKALQKKEIEEAKQYFLKATNLRATDFLSHAALGKIAVIEKKYKAALVSFEKASNLSPKRREFYIYQAQLLIEVVKQFNENINIFIADLSTLIKKMQFHEKINVEFQTTLLILQKYLNENEFVSEFELLQEITLWIEFSKNNQLTSVHLDEISLKLRNTTAKLNEKFLGQAEMILKKMPQALDRELEPYLIEQYLLEVEILYEKGDFDNLKELFNTINIAIKEKNISLSNKEKACLNYNYSKFLIATNQNEEAKLAISEAFAIDSENEEIKRLFMRLEKEKILWYGLDFIKKNEHDFEFQYAYAVALFNKPIPDLWSAKEHFFRSGLYNANVNYFLGKIEDPTYYYKRALKLSLTDALEFPYLLEIARYFLVHGKEEDLIELRQLFLQSGLLTIHSEAEKIFSEITKKINIQTVPITPKAINSFTKSDEFNRSPSFLKRKENPDLIPYPLKCKFELENFLSKSQLAMSVTPSKKPITNALADPLLEEVEYIYEDAINTKLMLGKAYLEREKFTKAADCFSQIYGAGVINSEICELYGVALLRAKDYQKAEHLLLTAIGMGKASNDAHSLYIEALGGCVDNDLGTRVSRTFIIG